jgi:HSP20 family molecular chaperone IbpA
MTRIFDAESWMWGEALAALERAEQQHRRFFGLLGAQTRASTWEPPADVFENDSEIRIVIALPGVDADGIKLKVEGPELVVQAERPTCAGMEAMHIRRLEIPYGPFERRILLPPGNYTLREQRLVNGCLELHLVRG